MSDIVSKIFGYTLGIVLMFLLPVMIIMLNFENEVEKYANDAVVEFVDKSRATGAITSGNLEEFIDKITATGNNYEIYICHESVYTYPEANGSYSTHYYSYYRDEIIEGIYQPTGTEDWNMKVGDYLRVSIEQEEAGFGSRLFSGIFGTQQTTHINTYGGYVGNNGEND